MGVEALSFGLFLVLLLQLPGGKRYEIMLVWFSEPSSLEKHPIRRKMYQHNSIIYIF